MSLLRHGLVIVGESCSGKSSMTKVIRNCLETLSKTHPTFQ